MQIKQENAFSSKMNYLTCFTYCSQTEHMFPTVSDDNQNLAKSRRYLRYTSIPYRRPTGQLAVCSLI